MGEKTWYVLHSKPCKENRLDAYLQSQGIKTFYPVLQVKPMNPRASTIHPYFPRHLFAHVDRDELGVSVLKRAPGAARLVEFGGIPANMPGHVICQLKERIGKINAAGELNLDGLQHGDTIRIIDGPFAGYEDSDIVRFRE
jgi:transcription antitermination factor NusG